MIGCSKVVLVSTSCSRCCILALTLCFMSWLPCVLWTISSLYLHIYSIDVLLYLYTLPISFSPILVKIKESGLDLFYFSFHFYFYFDLFFYFLFLEQLGLVIDRSCCHISHNLMVQSQDKSQNLGEHGRRFENK